MDLKKLAIVSDGKVSSNVDTSIKDNLTVDSFFQQRQSKIKDSLGLMPSRYKDRESWVKRNIRNIVSESGVSTDEVDFISDSIFKFIVSSYESKITRIKDSLGKSDSSLAEAKLKLKDSTTELKLYKEIGSVEFIKNKIQDAITSEETAKAQAEAARQQQEQAKQELESKQRELDLQKQENESLIEQQKQAQQQAQQMQREAEERQRELDQQKRELEDQKREQERIAQEQQKQEINRQQDSVIKDATDPIDHDLLTKYASAMEDFIQNGSNFTAEKLKQLADQIGLDDIIELTAKVTNYEPLDEISYDSLTATLKEQLKDQNLTIPSLALIQDSAFTEALQELPKREKEVDFNVVSVSIKNYLLDPNAENEAKLSSYIQGMPDIPLKKICQDAFFAKWCNEYRQKVADELSAICRKNNESLVIDFPTEYDIKVPTIKFDNLVKEKSIVEPVLTHVQYYNTCDSVNKVIDSFTKLRKAGLLKISDCECCACCPSRSESSVPAGWYVSNMAPVEGTPFISLIVNGLAQIFAVPSDSGYIDRAEYLASLYQKTVDDQYRIVTQELIPVNALLNLAYTLGQYDVVTDSVLYKRKLSSSEWVTDSMTKEDMLSTLDKFGRLLSDDVKSKITDLINKGGKQFRIAISDSELSTGKEFNSIRVRSYQDFDLKGRKLRLYIQ